jgi:hypothetical protein
VVPHDFQRPLELERAQREHRRDQAASEGYGEGRRFFLNRTRSLCKK